MPITFLALSLPKSRSVKMGKTKRRELKERTRIESRKWNSDLRCSDPKGRISIVGAERVRGVAINQREERQRTTFMPPCGGCSDDAIRQELESRPPRLVRAVFCCDQAVSCHRDPDEFDVHCNTQSNPTRCVSNVALQAR